MIDLHHTKKLLSANMDEIFAERKKLIGQIKNDVSSIWDIISEIGLKKYEQSNPKYIWKTVSTGYSDRACIFTQKPKGLFKTREIIIYNIDDKSCYEKLIREQDMRVFEAIEEASTWISGEVEKIKIDVDSFNEIYVEKTSNIENVISSYNSLKAKT